ncbi:FabD/lysophospholipase-like protein [Myriangium duriaei CBS 260.36]|uniref:FabD/lysophospholipase-like protein n=1 Tax=Myriangium duriaei CBS 260.36 TaxID=1168546 RepID=A0A9P4J6P6_9PEZI|nr:FabD/lysophospholipase-like protein [Myriangium duriaei CBS 260.36]
MPGRQINLLCIDGGGSKGLSALFILRKLMEFINPDNPPKPCEWFDMIGGTSTGGILAIMLGRLEMTVDECVEEYLALQNSAYVPIIGQYRYNHLTLEEGIKDILRKRGLPDDVLLKNTNKTACKVFVTATRAGSTTTEVLSSYYRRRGAAELFNTATVWQAARATSAASDFFRPVDIGPSERRFLDGETGANNPIFIMWEEAQNLLPSTGKVEQELNCLVSIGCGIKSLHKFGEDTSSLAQTLARIAIETENTAARFLNDKSLIADAGMYYRFSAPSVGDVEDVEERASVVQMTDHYIDARDTQDQLQLCTSKLLQRHGIASSIQTSDVRQAALIKSGNWSSQTIAYSGTSEREHFDIFDRMSKYDSDGTLERLSEYKCLGTCNWVVNKPSFRQWMELKTGSCFALTGIVGSGKTTCTTTVVEFLQDWASSTGRQVFHFFYESSFQSRLTALDVLEAFLKQMIIANPKIPDTLRSRVWKYYGPQAGRPHIGQLGKYLFLPLARYLNNAIFVIDGLYECEPTSQQDLMQLSPLLVAEGASLFLTLRESSGLMRRFENDSNVTICDCSLTEEGVKRDLETFITALIKEQNIRQRITEDQRTLALIKTALLGKTDAIELGFFGRSLL